MKKYKKYLDNGFTLIELLVVISIIGLLSSIVFASLNTARVKASDAAIKADLRGVRSSAEVEYSTIGDKYNNNNSAAILGANCSSLTGNNAPNTIFQNPGIQNAIKNVIKNNGNKDGICNLSADGNSFAMAFPLKTQGEFICIDNNKTTIVSDDSVPQTVGGPTAPGGGGFSTFTAPASQCRNYITDPAGFIIEVPCTVNGGTFYSAGTMTLCTVTPGASCDIPVNSSGGLTSAGTIDLCTVSPGASCNSIPPTVITSAVSTSCN